MTTLQSIRALVTRPSEQAETLVQKIQALGGHACSMPMVEINPLPEDQPIRSAVMALDQYSKIVVISHHAARLGMNHIENFWPQLPLKTDWFAIGEKTRNTLSAYDVKAFCPETPLDSEALLALDDFQAISGEKILLIKGKGGRELLQKELEARGALVHTLEVYERKQPEYTASAVQNKLKQHDINVILTSSGEILTNLAHYLSSEQLSSEKLSEFPKTCRLVVPSQRVEKIAQSMGFQQVYIAQGATDSAMLSVLSLINSEGLL